ncbi:MAG: DUF4160 domain-containing protein [Sphingobacteriaceae bacterium]|nr:DUF4160 domain-containing protein [Cytophagaceae bacterium]
MYGTDVYENRRYVHVGRKSKERLCKIWLEPEVEIAKSGELSISEQREVIEITRQFRSRLLENWEKVVRGEKVEILKID